MEQSYAANGPARACLTPGRLLHPPVACYRPCLFLYNYLKYIPMDDRNIPVRRLRHNPATGKWEEAIAKPLFIRGPIPLPWLEQAAQLPGKAFVLGIGLWWLHGMARDAEVKLSKRLLQSFNISRDAAADGLTRLEKAGLVQAKRAPGKRPSVRIVMQSHPSGAPKIATHIIISDEG